MSVGIVHATRSDSNTPIDNDGVPWLHLPHCVETWRALSDYDFDQLELLGLMDHRPVFRRRPHPDDLEGLPPAEASRIEAVLVTMPEPELRWRSLIEKEEDQ
jgi:hypothetical protein